MMPVRFEFRVGGQETLALPRQPGGPRSTTAGRRRLRPIVMTAAAAILALLPLALAIGQGSAMLQPLAIAIIAGLLLTVPLVLLVLPALIVLLGGARTKPSAH